LLATIVVLPTEAGWLRRNLRAHVALFIAFVVLTAFAISNVVFVGHYLLFELPISYYISRILGIFRSSGRFFWLVSYAQLAIVIVLGLRRARAITALWLASAAILQLCDGNRSERRLSPASPPGPGLKTTESGGPRGYDAAKKIKGRKRHIVTDTGGLLVGAEVHPADIQDRDGAVLVIEAIHQLFPWLRHLFADSVYNGPNLSDALTKFGNWTIEIVKRAADATGFKLLPRRWVVERTLAWLNRNRRLAKDFEASIASAEA
jgi:transposase